MDTLWEPERGAGLAAAEGKRRLQLRAPRPEELRTARPAPGYLSTNPSSHHRRHRWLPTEMVAGPGAGFPRRCVGRRGAVVGDVQCAVVREDLSAGQSRSTGEAYVASTTTGPRPARRASWIGFVVDHPRRAPRTRLRRRCRAPRHTPARAGQPRGPPPSRHPTPVPDGRVPAGTPRGPRPASGRTAPSSLTRTAGWVVVEAMGPVRSGRRAGGADALGIPHVLGDPHVLGERPDALFAGPPILGCGPFTGPGVVRDGTRRRGGESQVRTVGSFGPCRPSAPSARSSRRTG